MKRNIIFKIFFYILGMLITIAIVPVIINKLSISEFGLISLLNSGLSWLAIATIAITSSLGRNLIFSYSQNVVESSKELTTVVVAVFMLGIIIFPFLYFYAENILIKFGIEDQYLNKTTSVFRVMMFLFFVNAISNSFGATLFLKNKLDLLSINAFITQTSTYSFFLLFLIFTSYGFESYKLAMCLTSVILFSFTFLMYRRHCFDIKFNLRYFSFSKFKSSIGMSLWLVINQVGVLIIFQCGILFVQLYNGLDYVAYLTISLIISTQVRAIGTLISSLLEPTLIKAVADGNHSRSNNIFDKTVLVISIIIGLVCGIFIGSASQVLSFWLGEYDDIIRKSSILSVIYLPLILGFSCAWPVLMAHNKIKAGALITLVSGVLHVVITVIFYEFTNFGIYSVLFSTIIVMVIKNNILTPILLRSVGVNVKKMLSYSFFGFCYMLLVAVITYTIVNITPEHGLFSFISSLFLSSVLSISFPVIYLLVSLDIAFLDIFRKPKKTLLMIVNEI